MPNVTDETIRDFFGVKFNGVGRGLQSDWMDFVKGGVYDEDSVRGWNEKICLDSNNRRKLYEVFA